MRLSARNQIPARVTAINAGEAIANVSAEAGQVGRPRPGIRVTLYCLLAGNLSWSTGHGQ